MDKIIVQYEKDETAREQNGVCEITQVLNTLNEIKKFKIFEENSQSKFENFVDNTYKVHPIPFLTSLEIL